MTEKEIKKWIRFARKQGLQEFSIGELKFKFFETQKPIIRKNSKKLEDTTDPALLKNDPKAAMPSESDMLYWSTEAFDIITQTREEKEPRN